MTSAGHGPNIGHGYVKDGFARDLGGGPVFTRLTTTSPDERPAPSVMVEQAGAQEAAAAPSDEPADPFASIGIEV